jgi:hypothetical protein
VAVSIFELHNTRGVPLSTIDIVKAKLMKFVFDHGGDERDKNVANIQSEFGGIYAMEEQLSVSAFRGKLSIEQLLRLHLRVVDDGAKMANLDSPALNANGEALISHIESRLHFIDGDTTKPRDGASGVSYALALAKEFRESMRIVSQELPCWDRDEPLVGDVMIFEPQLSCQFFLLVCRRLKRVSLSTLKLWERLLFTRDFHDRYYRMTYRDDFPSLFALCGSDQEAFANVIKRYVQDGFRPHLTKDLQRIVRESLEKYKETILTDAFDWWKKKMTYAIYKYEASKSAQIRDVMKGRPSVEHILPRAWEELRQGDAVLREMSDHEWNAFRDRINACIDGLGNLLLISGSENSSLGNSHPADKPYERSGGSYQEHDQNSETWRLSSNWESLIRERGEKIFSFMIHHLVGEV